MKQGDLVRVHHSFRAHYGPGRVVEFHVGTHAVIVSKFFTGGREYYDILVPDGGVWAVAPGTIEPAGDTPYMVMGGDHAGG